MMKQYSTREAAKKLGLHLITIQKYIAAGKIPVPAMSISIGGGKVRVWSDEDIERVREVLPTIANGRKTRYQKLREKGPQAGAPALRKKKSPKKKKSKS